MEIIIILLFVIAAALFVFSYFLPDQTKELKEELDQLTVQLFHDSYVLKKRIKVLEEELLLPNDISSTSSKASNPIIVKQVELLHEQGLSIEQIARQAAITEEEAELILEMNKGANYTNE